MKKLLTVLFVLTICTAVGALAQPTMWQFVKVFPDTATSFAVGLHGIAVGPDGKIWVGPAGTSAADSLPNGTKTAAIRVYNPDGTESSISGIKIINTPGASDTLASLCRGMRTAPNGNIVYVGIGGQVFELDYKTGAGIRKVNPVAPSVASGIAPAFTSAGEMFTGHVLPGNPVKIWDDQFSNLGTAIDASVGYSRTMEVSKDGNNIFWCGYSTKRVYIYHSDLGTLGTYTLTDSMAIGCQVESTGWNIHDGLLYMSSGNIDTTDYGSPPVDSPWTATTWYGFDVTTKTQKDSIAWDWAAYPYTIGAGGGSAPRPRGIDFSPSGDTAYVVCYNHSKAAMQMFKRVLTSVKPIDDRVPHTYDLAQNYPNPFNPTTEIEFSLPKAGATTLKVYDILGQEVASLINENLTPGTYKVHFDASRLSSGTYIYMLNSGSTSIAKKMMLIK